MTADLNVRVGYVGTINLQTLDGQNLAGQKLAERRGSYGSYYGIEWSGAKVKYYGANLNAIDKTVLGVVNKNRGAVAFV